MPDQTQDMPYGGRIQTSSPIPLGVQGGELSESTKALIGISDGDLKMGEKIDGLSKDDGDYLASMVHGEFSVASSAREEQEDVWIRAHQNLKGVYPSGFDFGEGSSRAFVQITRPKVQTFIGMILPILEPPGTNSWTIDPDPVNFDHNFVRSLISQGIPMDQIHVAISRKAELAGERLTTKAKQALIDDGWPQKLAKTVKDAGDYGTSIIMGPLAEDTGVEPDPILQAIGEQELYRPSFEVISPFSFYPDPCGTCIEDCGYVIVRKVIGKPALRKLRNKPGFDKSKIDSVLSQCPDGNWSPESWESDLNIANGLLDSSTQTGRYVCLVRWGWLSGKDLKDNGIDVPEDMLEDQIMAQLWVIDNRVISIRTSQLHQDRLPFYVTPYNAVQHCIWGMGLPEEMFDSQDAVNAMERAKMDNMGLSARPMASVNVDLLDPGENVVELRAGKIIKTRYSELSPGGKAVEFYTPPCNLGDIQAVQDKALYLAQEQTAMPNVLMGQGGEGAHNRTFGGASLQFNAAITPIKTVTFNFENHLIVPLITSIVKFYQKFSKDKLIVGNYKIAARGVQGIMARETLLNLINTTVQVLSGSPDGAERIDYEQIGKLMVRYNDLVDSNIILPNSVVEENRRRRMQEELAQNGQELGQQVHADKIRAETSPKDALLETFKGAQEGSLTKMTLMKMIAQTYQFLDQELNDAIDYDIKSLEIGAEDAAHAAGVAQADRVHVPPPQPKVKK